MEKLLTEISGLEMELNGDNLSKYLTFRLDGESESIAINDKEAEWLKKAFELRDKPGKNLLVRVMEMVGQHYRRL